MIRSRTRLFVALAAGVGTLFAFSPTAGAATNLGTTFDPPDFCASDTTYLVTSAPGDIYTVPFNGVITSWSFHAGSLVPETLRLKVGRAVSGSDLSADDTDLSVIGESIFQVPSASSLNTFSSRVSVKQGDFLGIYLGGTGNVQCSDSTQTVYVDHFNSSEVLAGATADFSREQEGQIEVAAVLEPDADQDGFGDETQDQCPSNPETKGQCPVAPVTTTATKKKCKKHKKQRSAESAKKKKCKKKKTRH